MSNKVTDFACILQCYLRVIVRSKQIQLFIKNDSYITSMINMKYLGIRTKKIKTRYSIVFSLKTKTQIFNARIKYFKG